MVFSLFARKDKLDSRKDPPAGARGAVAPTPAAQREAARRTKEKIDRIESEMIAAEAVARAGQSSLPTKPAGADGEIEPKAAPVEGGTSLVLGDAAGANAIDVTGPALPPILEEAAILYSNGQPQPAALVLRQSLDDPELAGFRPLAWLMLLDLHQCVGDRSGFDALALQYAAQFESSPPGWSDALSAAHATASATPRAAPASSSRSLSLSGAIDASIAERARSFAEHADGDATLDCSQATSLDAQGAQALLSLLARLERARSGLSIIGAERMLAVARASIEPGRRDPSEACWMLALQALRLLGRQQDFDDLGIEYCVTYEVSPPSWEPPADAFRVLCPQEPAVEQASASAGALASAAATAARAPSAATGAFVLQGDVLGRMQDELHALRSFAAGRGDVVVDCRSLRRMEFVAAGDLLNEVATMRSAGRQVLFIEPNYLVYALMLVMGIHDLAEIRRRRV
ncbi:MAG: STAS domain-containing protein [Burkholderiaceae bacterium]|nr:STAS domain-containing protein [Burkholderiaceae bacterium]